MAASHIWTNDAPLTYEAAQARRIAWFNKIAPKPDWKTAINAVIADADFENCNAAAIFFTGSALTIKGAVMDGLRVTAPGYYATVGM
jgi:hypothetical protein